MAIAAKGSLTPPVPAQDIARSENISLNYVEQILSKLKAANLLQSHRGIRGGFTLAKPAQTISVLDIVEATEGKLALTPCKTGPCARANECAARRVWDEATQALENIFAAANIQDLTESATQQATATPSFEI